MTYADPFDVRRSQAAPGLLAVFNDAGVLAAADVHVAGRLAALFAEPADGPVALAAALAVRAPRLGHVFVDLATIRDTATVDTDEPVDISGLPWPDPDGWMADVAGSPLAVGDGLGPLHLDGSRLVPRPLPRRGASDRRRPDRARRWSSAGGRRCAARRRCPAALRRRRRRPAGARRGGGSGRARLGGRRRSRHRQDHHRGADPGAPVRAGRCSGRTAAPDRARRADRQGGRASAGVGSRGGGAVAGAARGSRPASGSGRHNTAPPAGLALRQRDTLPPRPRQPACLRRRRGRRDVDGVAVTHGSAGRGGAARCAARPARRPRATHVRRGGRCAGRHRRARRRHSPDVRGRAVATVQRGWTRRCLRGPARGRRAGRRHRRSGPSPPVWGRDRCSGGSHPPRGCRRDDRRPGGRRGGRAVDRRGRGGTE